MSEASFLDYTLQALMLVLVLSLPPIIVASVTGILVSLVQALTQIQEQTISFAVKLVAVVVTIILTANWLGEELYRFAESVFLKFPMIVP